MLKLTFLMRKATKPKSEPQMNESKHMKGKIFQDTKKSIDLP